MPSGVGQGEGQGKDRVRAGVRGRVHTRKEWDENKAKIRARIAIWLEHGDNMGLLPYLVLFLHYPLTPCHSYSPHCCRR